MSVQFLCYIFLTSFPWLPPIMYPRYQQPCYFYESQLAQVFKLTCKHFDGWVSSAVSVHRSLFFCFPFRTDGYKSFSKDYDNNTGRGEKEAFLPPGEIKFLTNKPFKKKSFKEMFMQENDMCTVVLENIISSWSSQYSCLYPVYDTLCYIHIYLYYMYYHAHCTIYSWHFHLSLYDSWDRLT